MNSFKCSTYHIANLGLKSIVRIEEFALSVEILNLSKNLIVDLSPLSELLELRELDLSDNSMLENCLLAYLLTC